ncbi:MAG: HEAT repeat domain-containing protein [Tahibacter sp.]
MSSKFILAMCLGWCSIVSANASELSSRLAALNGWASWQVPMIDGVGAPCCMAQLGKDFRKAICNLDSRESSWGSSDQDPRSKDTMLAVYAHVTAGKVDRLRGFSGDCPVVADQGPQVLQAISPADTVNWLREVALVPSDSRKDLADPAVSTLAFVADVTATRVLSELADSDAKKDLRESALFWLAQNRGADGAASVEKFARGKADPELRAHALFALSQSPLPDHYTRVRDIGAQDSSEHVRSQALFWMAQMDDERARDDILAALTRETTEEGQEQAVFALSQLPHGAADPALIAVVRGKYARAVKQRALFWLGQSGSDAALSFLDEMLAKPTAATR